MEKKRNKVLIEESKYRELNDDGDNVSTLDNTELLDLSFLYKMSSSDRYKKYNNKKYKKNNHRIYLTVKENTLKISDNDGSIVIDFDYDLLYFYKKQRLEYTYEIHEQKVFFNKTSQQHFKYIKFFLDIL